MLSTDEHPAHPGRAANAQQSGGDQTLDSTQTDVEHLRNFLTRIYPVGFDNRAFGMVCHNGSV